MSERNERDEAVAARIGACWDLPDNFEDVCVGFVRAYRDEIQAQAAKELHESEDGHLARERMLCERAIASETRVLELEAQVSAMAEDISAEARAEKAEARICDHGYIHATCGQCCGVGMWGERR